MTALALYEMHTAQEASNHWSTVSEIGIASHFSILFEIEEWSILDIAALVRSLAVALMLPFLP